MTINFSTPHDQIEMRPRITVVGVGLDKRFKGKYLRLLSRFIPF